MNVRFPLYARILLWFLVNLLVVGVALLMLFRSEFRVESLLMGRASEQLQAVGELMAFELNEAPRAEWGKILARFRQAYQVDFLLFRGDGQWLAGPTDAIVPRTVLERIRSPQPSGPRRNPMSATPGEWPDRRPGEFPGERSPGEPPPEDRPRPRSLNESPPTRPAVEPAPRPPREPGLPRDTGLAREPGPPPGNPPLRFFLRSENPTRYWAGTRLPLAETERPRGAAHILVAASSSMSGGGLFFNPTPWLLAGLGAVLVSALLWFPIVRGVTRSIGAMRRATEEIAEGRFEARVPAGRRDELGALGGAINRMAVRLGGFVTGQKRFLGDIAHELCAPIARIQMALGILEQRARAEQKPYVEDLREEVQHMSALVNELLSFSKAGLRPQEFKLAPVPLAELARLVAQREAGAEYRDRVRLEIAERLHALGDRELLSRALANLLRNALRYAGHAGPITITALPVEGDRIVLTVADSGPGVPAETLPQIFDPFFRVENSRSRDTGGTGLGLAIVKTCVEACQGTVSARNRSEGGLEVNLHLRSATDIPPGVAGAS